MKNYKEKNNLKKIILFPGQGFQNIKMLKNEVQEVRFIQNAIKDLSIQKKVKSSQEIPTIK